MSESIWGIEGIGIALDEAYIDTEKLEKAAGIDEGYEDMDELICECDVQDLFTDIIPDKYRGNICIDDRGNAETEYFLLYYATYPWNMKDWEKDLTEEKIKEIIADILMTIVEDGTTKEDLIDNIDYISTYGRG